MRRLRVLRGQVLQGGNNSVVSSIPTDPSATHGPPDRACHFKTFNDHSSMYRNDTATKRAAKGSDDLDVATVNKKQRYALHSLAYKVEYQY